MLAYSSVAQAGYMLAGIVVASKLGAQATVFYLAVYLFMNMAAFAVILARERSTDLGDTVAAMRGIGRSHPHLAWPMTLSMLGLAGIPATAGFMGKFYLIDAAVDGGYTWLGVVIVIGSMISLGYYLPVIAAMWMSDAPADASDPTSATPVPGSDSPVESALPALAGGSQELDKSPAGPAAGPNGESALTAGVQPEVTLVAIVAGAATLFFGIVPQPLFNLVHGVGSALGLL
jgi:NADH-quinone oxidoreductase subunit N